MKEIRRLRKKLLAGYWHNFVNAAGAIRLTDIPVFYDIVNIAFATPMRGSTSLVVFSPMENYSDAEFKADIKVLQESKKKVLLSIGGAETTVRLLTREDVRNFVGSVTGLVELYGFDGIDIDFENYSLFLDEGDVDIRKPVTAAIVNLIDALRLLRIHFGPRFILTMAPETFFMQQGFVAYGGQQQIADRRAGCALALVENLRDVVSYLWVQQYNSDPIQGLDGNTYRAGTPEFHVVLLEMLLKGFPIACDRGISFAPLDPEQLFLGIPASKEAGAGYLDQSIIKEVLTYLTKGVECGSAYKLRSRDAYAGLGGVMMWSINWDVYAGCHMSKSIRAHLDSLQYVDEEKYLLQHSN